MRRVREFFRWRKEWGTSWYGITGEPMSWVLNVMLRVYLPALREQINSENVILRELRRYE